MKKFLFIFFIIFLSQNILIANQTQKLSSEEKFVEIQKCLFLEKQLIPSPNNLTLPKKIFKNIYPIIISVLIAHIIYKTLEFAKRKISKQKTNEQVSTPKIKALADALKKLSSEPCASSLEIKFPATPNPQNQQKNSYKFSLVFAIASPIYLLIKFLGREKEKTQLQILTSFIKNWTENKINIPEKFHQRFDHLCGIYKNTESLDLTELEAERIIRTTIMEVIDYKIALQGNYTNLRS